MANEKSSSECCGEKKNMNANASGGAIYGMGLIGALVYYLSNADSFGVGVLGFLKALVWPAMLVYKLLEFLKM